MPPATLTAAAATPSAPTAKPRPPQRRRRGVRRTPGEWAVDLTIVVLLAALAFVTLYPFLYVLTISLSSNAESQQVGFHLLPVDPTFDAWRAVLESSGILRAYGNTIIRTVAGTFLSVLLTSMMAYPLAQKTFPHRRLINFLLLFSLLFGGGFIPLFLLVKNLGMLDTRWSLILPGAVAAMNVILMRNFFQAIPRELTEAARVDGASELRILFRVVLPLSKPVLAVISLWTALAHWNSWFDALLYINDPDKQVLQMFIRNTVVTQHDAIITDVGSTIGQSAPSPQSLSAAAIMIATLPIIILYPFLQRYFTQGILLGSVKG